MHGTRSRALRFRCAIAPLCQGRIRLKEMRRLRRVHQKDKGYCSTSGPHGRLIKRGPHGFSRRGQGMVRRVQKRWHFFEPFQLHNARAPRYARGRGVSLQRMRQRLNSLYINRAVLAQFARKPRKLSLIHI